MQRKFHFNQVRNLAIPVANKGMVTARSTPIVKHCLSLVLCEHAAFLCTEWILCAAAAVAAAAPGGTSPAVSLSNSPAWDGSGGGGGGRHRADKRASLFPLTDGLF
jgi:hypothetical protein